MMWRGLVDRLFFLYTVHMFFSHHETQVQGNENGGEKSYTPDNIYWVNMNITLKKS